MGQVVTVRGALEADLNRIRMSQEELGRRLDPPVSQQAISKWLAENRVPAHRVDQLKAILGDGSELTQLLASRQPPYAHRLPHSAEHRFDPGVPRKNPEPVTPNLREHTAEAEFYDTLPAELTPYTDTQSQLPANLRQIDYMSPRLGLELLCLASPQSLLLLGSRKLVQILALRAVTAHSAPDRTYVLALCVSPDVMPRASGPLQRLASEASLLGVRLLTVPNGIEAAQFVIEFEGRPTGVADLFDANGE